MTLYEVVMKLIGEVDPVGSTEIDNSRYANLKELTLLVDKLVFDIDRIASGNKDRQEFSMRRAGEHCDEFLNSLGIEQ